MPLDPHRYAAFLGRNLGPENDPDNQTPGVKLLLGGQGDHQPVRQMVGQAIDQMKDRIEDGKRYVDGTVRGLAADAGGMAADFAADHIPEAGPLILRGMQARDMAEGRTPDRTAATPAAAMAPSDDDVGELSRSKESKEGAAAVSTGLLHSGRPDPGGVSYGSYQFATNRGTPQAFQVSPEAARWRSRFDGLAAGSPAYSAVWRAIAKEDPQGFESAQDHFARRTYLQPQVKAVKDATGLDLSSRSRALRNAILSTAIQHGAKTDLIGHVVGELRRAHLGREPTDSELINGIYAKRKVRHPADAPRYRSEGQMALDMLARERDGT